MVHNVEANGASKPAIGLGTWDLRGDTCVDIVREAIGLGYRHVDTARMYANEREVGEGIRASGIDRGDLFLTTKVWHDQLAADALEASVDASLADLGTDYADLILIHWPDPDVPLKETLGALSRVRRDGRARHIGISNFPVALIEEAVAISDEPIVTNQVEWHVYLDQSKVLDACRRHGISVTCYCPIARGKVVGDPLMADVAARHGKSETQVALRWLVQQPGVVAIPRTSNRQRLAENLDIADFALSEEDMAAIGGLAHPQGRMVNAAWAPDWD